MGREREPVYLPLLIVVLVVSSFRGESVDRRRSFHRLFTQMDPVDTSEGIDGLILRTATMVDPSLIPSKHRHQ